MSCLERKIYITTKISRQLNKHGMSGEIPGRCQDEQHAAQISKYLKVALCYK